MKKITNLVLILCLFVGMVGLNRSISAKENSKTYTVTTVEYSSKQKEQLKNTNHVFSQEELKGTAYSDHSVEAIEGKLYVDGRIVYTVAVWYMVSGVPKLAAWMAAGGVITMVNNYTMKAELKNWLKSAYTRFSNMTDAYCKDQKLLSVKLSNGNECMAVSATQYACKFSIE